jgi:hypothetical protein
VTRRNCASQQRRRNQCAIQASHGPQRLVRELLDLDDMEPSPSNEERRKILRGQHERLRATIAHAQEAARGVLTERGLAGELQAAVLALRSELLAHLAEEERLLEPVLTSIDAWGPVRVGLLRAEHAHQRAVLAVLTGPTAWPAATLVAGRTLSLCDDLLTDMEFEERELLGETLLRDDLIQLDASDA